MLVEFIFIAFARNGLSSWFAIATKLVVILAGRQTTQCFKASESYCSLSVLHRTKEGKI
jgi:hypothetical protein